VDSRARRIAFVVLVLVCVGIAAVAVSAGLRGDDAGGDAAPGADKILTDARTSHEPVVLYRDTEGVRAGAAAPVEIAPVADPNAGKRTGLSCNRVYYAAGRGICLVRGGGFAAGYQARIFGPDLKAGKAVDVQGIPSRARVSPDGRYGSVTLFVAGDSYAAAGAFSTRTTLIDLARGTSLGDLEKFTTYDAHQRQVTAQDVNYWGVTFSPTDSDRFYATLATGGKTHLIEGSVTRRTARVVHDNVECPSLSPDGTRIAYKQRTGDQDRPWRLTVLDLASMRETHLAETRSVDDQAEWRDDGHVVYGVDGAVWSVPADGTGAPTRLVDHADSPAVVRG
jgi:hypothetical protein